MPLMSLRTCNVCDRTYELLEHPPGEFSAMDHDDIDHITCPEPSCGSADYRPGGGGWRPERKAENKSAVVGGKRFPYFDRGLGCEVRDPSHHRWLLKHHPDGTPRERPLIAAEGGLDVAKWAADDRYEAEEDRRKFQEYMREMQEGPNREEYARVMADVQARMAGRRTR